MEEVKELELKLKQYLELNQNDSCTQCSDLEFLSKSKTRYKVQKQMKFLVVEENHGDERAE